MNQMYLCRYVCIITHSKSNDQPGKVANPARGQLQKENEYFPVHCALQTVFKCVCVMQKHRWLMVMVTVMVKVLTIGGRGGSSVSTSLPIVGVVSTGLHCWVPLSDSHTRYPDADRCQWAPQTARVPAMEP